MIRKTILIHLLSTYCLIVIMTSFANALEPVSGTEKRILQERLIPPPVSVDLFQGSLFFKDELSVSITLHPVKTEKSPFSPEEQQKRIARCFDEWFGCKPKIVWQNGTDSEKPLGAYSMQGTETLLTVDASGFDGVFNAMKTLRQLAEPIPGTKVLEGYRCAPFRIEDSPRMNFRGIHVCWFPETKASRIEQAIRIAASYKFNYLVLELWGVYPYKALPKFCHSKYQISEQEIRRLVQVGKDMGIKLIPQFNIFGHAAASRGPHSGKHALLDYYPEFQPLFEPDGWTWCLSNPETRRILTEMTLELIDLFDHPEFFHLGCDEAYSAGTCFLCRNADYQSLLLDHLTYFANLVDQKGARPMMWHDMLIDQNDSRWRGYTVQGNAATAALVDKIPKRMILCDWQYENPKEKETWPTVRYFLEKKYDVLVCPFDKARGIKSLGQFAIDNHCFGMLCTTWHLFYGEIMSTILVYGSRVAWGTDSYQGNSFGIVDHHLRQMGWDRNIAPDHYEDTGRREIQVPRER